MGGLWNRPRDVSNDTTRPPYRRPGGVTPTRRKAAVGDGRRIEHCGPIEIPNESFWEGQHGILWAARTSVAEYGTFVTCCSAQLLPSGVSTPWNHNRETLTVQISDSGEKHGGQKVSRFKVGEDKY